MKSNDPVPPELLLLLLSYMIHSEEGSVEVWPRIFSSRVEGTSSAVVLSVHSGWSRTLQQRCHYVDRRAGHGDPNMSK